MEQTRRRRIVWFALAAMLLRALLPLGWMPGSFAAGVPLVICTPQGAKQIHLGQDGKPVSPEPGSAATAACVFSAAAPLAPAPGAIAVAPARIVATETLVLASDANRSGRVASASHPRAPPFVS
jgi:hypothetical protein